MERDTIQSAIVTILQEIEGPGLREGVEDTPARVARMYEEIFSGYHVDIESLLARQFEDDTCLSTYGGIVLVKDIPFYSMCEHHMMPFFGHAHIGYIPDGPVVGISKLARLVDAYARRLQVQERLTEDIMGALREHLDPKGVMVVIEAEHLCMSARGVKKPGTKTITSSVYGVFDDDPASRAEFLSLIK